MSNNRGIKFKILLNSLLSVFIFAMFLVYISNIYWNELLDSKKEKLQNIVEVGSTIVSHFIDLEKKVHFT